MIEIRAFEGDAEELSRFINCVWRRSYEGRMLVPLWNGPFLQRELLSGDGAARDYLVAAYDGTKLVGLHPARAVNVRLHGQEVPVTWGSFLSVDPDYRGQKIAQRMQEESIRRHRQHGAHVNFGYLYIRSAQSLGPKFWLQQPEGTTIVAKVGMWMRAVDHAAAARFELNRFESLGARLTALWQRPPRPPADSSGTRLYRSEDLPACVDLIRSAGQHADLAYLWDASRLESQLAWPGLSQTVVAERAGTIAGLVNYTLLEVLGRVPCVLAVMDFVAFGALSSRQRRRLLAAALYQMKLDGAGAAIMLRGSWYAARELWAAGFFPMVPEYYYIGTRMLGDRSLKGVRRMQVLWR